MSRHSLRTRESSSAAEGRARFRHMPLSNPPPQGQVQIEPQPYAPMTTIRGRSHEIAAANLTRHVES
jgi:hypothetical protein